jgi:hypothetical protein
MLQRKPFLTLSAGMALALSSLVFEAAPSLAAGGQTGSIRGTIVDANSTAVAGADVTLKGPSARYAAHTDGRGQFIMVGVLTDVYTLTVRQNGTVKINQPNIGVVGDGTVDLGTITLPAS